MLLFTSKKSTPPLFKALSKELKEKLNFAEIRDSSLELIERFNIKVFPAVCILSEPSNYKCELYDKSDFSKASIFSFLKENALPKKKAKSKGIVEFSSKATDCGVSDNALCILIIF